MDIHFASVEIQKLCEEETFATRKLGRAVATRLRIRLNELAAAANLSELISGKPHPLKGDFSGCFGIRLDGACRIVVRPDHDPVPTLESGGIDRTLVTIVCVEFIGDYHDN